MAMSNILAATLSKLVAVKSFVIFVTSVCKRRAASSSSSKIVAQKGQLGDSSFTKERQSGHCLRFAPALLELACIGFDIPFSVSITVSSEALMFVPDRKEFLKPIIFEVDFE